MDAGVFAMLNLAAHGREQIERFESGIQKFSEVMECYTMTGAWDYMLKIIVRGVPA